MLKKLKFSGQETDFFFVSDLHFGHNRDFIYTKRANPITKEVYKTVEEHDKGVIDGWNSVCNKSSIVFNCGDVVFNDSDGSRFWNLMRSLSFNKHYILWGNHTSGHRQAYLKVLKEKFPQAFKGEELDYEVYPLEVELSGNPDKVIVFLPEYAEVSINSSQIVLCHYPLTVHNHMSHNSICLSGHSHSSCFMTNKNTGTGMRLDLGLESFGRPISLKEVKYHLRNRDIDPKDHHGK